MPSERNVLQTLRSDLSRPKPCIRAARFSRGPKRRWARPTEASESLRTLLELFLVGGLLLRCFNLVIQFVFRTCWIILNVVRQIIRGWQSLPPNCCLAAAEKCT